MKGVGFGGIYGVKGAVGGSSVFAKPFGPALYWAGHLIEFNNVSIQDLIYFTKEPR